MTALDKKIYTESSATTSQVQEMISHVRSFRRYPKGYRAICLHFSVLDRLHQQPHHRRSIATAFNKLISSNEGKLFWLDTFDLFFICKDCTHTQLEKAKFDAIRAVSDSPILKQIIAQSKDDEICDWYDLGLEYNLFFTLIKQIADNPSTTDEDEEQEKIPTLQNLMANLDQDEIEVPLKKDVKPEPIEKKIRTIPNYNHIFPKDKTPPMGPVQLDKLERNVQNIDMFSMIAEQNICVIIDNMPPQVVFNKKYISLKEVNNSILPGYNIAADKWLFQRLTKTFDRKVMQSLINNNNFPQHVLSINMNVSTVLTKEFDTFVKKQKVASDHPLILELTLFDIISDLNEYYQARKKIKKLGCKVCISKMDIQSLYILDRELINVDFLKINWNKNYETTISKSEKLKIIEAIEAQGKMRVVLSGCDTQQALKFGNSIGVVMYQGFEVDKLQGLL